MTAANIISFAKRFIGAAYILGAFVPKSRSDYKGAFDCAEFVAYVHFQLFGFLYGCDTADVKRAAKADAYTGYFDRDAQKQGVVISVDEAARTEGAMLFRKPTGSAVGHIAFSQGNGQTVEAHSSKTGVIESKVDGRRWSYGIKLPGVEYKVNPPVATTAPLIVYRLKRPYMKSPFIAQVQRKLNILDDGIYGVNTQAAVVKFQRIKGLIPDGEVMPGGETARALGIK